MHNSRNQSAHPACVRASALFSLATSHSPLATWLVALVLTILLAPSAHATTYYVAAAGSDSNNGTTTGTPWAHAPGMPACANTCAGATLQPGDSVLFNRG